MYPTGSGCFQLSSNYNIQDLGPWFRAKPDLHMAWMAARTRQHAIVRRELFNELIEGSLPAVGRCMAITYSPEVSEGFPDMVAWMIESNGVQPIALDGEPECLGIRQLEGTWPMADVGASSVMLIGVGSIGAVAAHSLAAYGIGRLVLLDPDVLSYHNLVRHHSDARDVGNLKVNALREELRQSRPDTTAEAHDLDVVTNADQVRRLSPSIEMQLASLHTRR